MPNPRIATRRTDGTTVKPTITPRIRTHEKATVSSSSSRHRRHAGARGALDDGNLSISGFGTSASPKAIPTRKFARYNQADGVGDSARLGLDTNLGLQATYKINDWLSGTAQVLTRKPPAHLHHRPDLGLPESPHQR
jgi:hypothetical protein